VYPALLAAWVTFLVRIVVSVGLQGLLARLTPVRPAQMKVELVPGVNRALAAGFSIPAMANPAMGRKVIIAHPCIFSIQRQTKQIYKAVHE
jgi:hypothetical protein